MSLFRISIHRILCCSLLLSLAAFAHDNGKNDNGKNKVVGAVFSMTNSAIGNAVVVFDRMSDGTLALHGTVSTGGKGSGAPLASQSSLKLSDDGRYLFTSNAGSNSISVFSVNGDKLKLLSTASSGGSFPYSIAVHGPFVYVLNAGANGGANSTVSGLVLDWNGHLWPIPGSTRGLSKAFVDPAQVGFSPDGDKLIVTERGTDTIDVFSVIYGGWLGARVENDSAGSWPYGFAFGKNDELFVSEAAAMAANASTMSSYTVQWNGKLKTVSGAIPTHLTAACWTVVSPNAKYVYTTDALSAAISGFSIDHHGAIDLLDSDGVTAKSTIGFTVDQAFSSDGHYLYALSILGSGISVFHMEPDGSLTPVQSVPNTSVLAGLAAE